MTSKLPWLLLAGVSGGEAIIPRQILGGIKQRAETSAKAGDFNASI